MTNRLHYYGNVMTAILEKIFAKIFSKSATSGINFRENFNATDYQ